MVDSKTSDQKLQRGKGSVLRRTFVAAAATGAALPTPNVPKLPVRGLTKPTRITFSESAAHAPRLEMSAGRPGQQQAK
jgi:hypothetical protein